MRGNNSPGRGLVPKGFAAGVITFLLLASVLIALNASTSIISSNGPFADQDQYDLPARVRGSVPIVDQTWPMFGRDWHHSSQGGNADRGIGEPVAKWSRDAALDSWGTTIGRFRNNQTGVLFTTDSVVYSNQGSIFIREGETGALQWRLDVTNIDNLTTAEMVPGAVAIQDLSGNGDPDIVFGVQRQDGQGRIYAFEPELNHNGSSGYWWNGSNYDKAEKLWEYNTNGDLTSSSPTITDINGDTYLDIVMGVGALTSSGVGRVVALTGTTGTEIFSANVSGRFISSPAVLEYNPTVNYIICAGMNASHYTVYNFNTDGSENWNKPFFLSTGAYIQIPAPVVGDFHTSTGYEIGVCIPFRSGNNGQVTVLRSSNGDEIWGSPVTVTGQIESTPAVLDVDGDAREDLIVISKPLLTPNIQMYALNGISGQEIWSQQKALVVNNVVSQPVVTDILKDGFQDVLFAAANVLWAVNGSDGRYLWNHTASSSHVFDTSPAVGDIDQDDFLDIALDGMVVTQRIVDLTLGSDDIAFNVVIPTENTESEVSAKITNAGKNTALNVWVSFFENGTLIGSDFLDEVVTTRTASVYWTPSEGGIRRITVVADPNGTVAEINESNNQAFKDIWVEDVFSDLVVSGMRYFRPDGKEADNLQVHLIKGLKATFSANISNIGKDTAENISVKFIAEGETFSDNLSVEILEPGGWALVNTTWSIPVDISSPATISVAADFDKKIKEEKENNNLFTEDIEIIPRDATGNVFMIRGQVFRDDNVTFVSSANVVITNLRTNQQLFNTTDETGSFAVDLSKITSGYYEGDPVDVFASDPSGGFSNSTQFIVYSEDGGIDVRIVIREVEQYNFQFEIKDNDKSVNPSQTIKYYLIFTNLGNRQNHINITLGNPYASGGKEAENWTFDLQTDTVVLSVGASANISLAVTAPPPEKAPAGSFVDLMVSAKSDEDPSIVHNIQTRTTVNTYHNLTLTQKKLPEIDPNFGDSGTITFSVENTGNMEMSGNIRTYAAAGINTSGLSPTFSLAVGQRTDMGLDIEVNGSVAPGTYPINIVFNATSSGLEFTRSVYFDLVLPDIVITPSDIQIPPTIKIGTPDLIRVEVENAGTADALGVLVKLKIGDNDVGQNTTDIAAGAVKTMVFEVTITTQEFTVKAQADPYKAIIEMDEDNNLAALNYTMAFDIKADGLTHSPKNPAAGDVVNLTVSFSNPNNNFNLPFTVAFFTGNTSASNIITTRVFDEPFTPGVSHEVAIQWTVPEEINGTVTIWASLDSTNVIAETDESNNNVSEVITISVPSTGGDDDDSSLGGRTIMIIAVVVIVIIVALIGVYYFFSQKEQDEKKDEADDDRVKADGSEKGGKEGKEGKEGPETIDIDITGLDDKDAPDDELDDDDDDEDDGSGYGGDIDSDEDDDDDDEYIEMELVDDEGLDDDEPDSEFDDGDEYGEHEGVEISGEDDDGDYGDDLEEEGDYDEDAEALEVEPLEVSPLED